MYCPLPLPPPRTALQLTPPWPSLVWAVVPLSEQLPHAPQKACSVQVGLNTATFAGQDAVFGVAAALINCNAAIGLISRLQGLLWTLPSWRTSGPQLVGGTPKWEPRSLLRTDQTSLTGPSKAAAPPHDTPASASVPRTTAAAGREAETLCSRPLAPPP